jgi:hypothetical protein
MTGANAGKPARLLAAAACLALWCNAVRVVPSGAFVLTGFVSTFEDALLPGSKVEATSSAGSFTIVSDPDGRVRVPAAGETVVRVERTGLPVTVKHLWVYADDFYDWLVPRAGAGTLTGGYSLTFATSSSCTMRGRWTYAVDVEEWHGNLVVRAQGQRFIAFGPVGFSGTRDGDAVRFSCAAPDHRLELVRDPATWQ